MIDKHESITAKLCSFVRAFHSIYEKNKVFDDYLAYDLMGQDEYIKVGQLIEHNFDGNLYDEKATFYKENVLHAVNSLMAPIAPTPQPRPIPATQVMGTNPVSAKTSSGNVSPSRLNANPLHSFL